MLSVKEATGLVTNRSLLILVDHSKTALTLSKDFMIYLPKPSSSITTDGIRIFQIMRLSLYRKWLQAVASELVTELIQFQNSKQHRFEVVASKGLDGWYDAGY